MLYEVNFVSARRHARSDCRLYALIIDGAWGGIECLALLACLLCLLVCPVCHVCLVCLCLYLRPNLDLGLAGLDRPQEQTEKKKEKAKQTEREKKKKEKRKEGSQAFFFPSFFLSTFGIRQQQQKKKRLESGRETRRFERKKKRRRSGLYARVRDIRRPHLVRCANEKRLK